MTGLESSRSGGRKRGHLCNTWSCLLETEIKSMERISVDGLYSWEGVKDTQKTKMIDQSIRSFSRHSGEIKNHLALNMIINGKTQMLSLMFFFSGRTAPLLGRGFFRAALTV